VLTQLKSQKPQYAPFVASIQAVLNESFGPLGILAYGVAGSRVTATDVNNYVSSVKSEIASKLQPLGVAFDFSASPTTGGLTLSWTATKGTNSDTGSHTITGNVEDVSDDWLQSLSIAANRFSRWVQTLDATKAKSILDAAAIGYQAFMTGGTPTAKQQMAALKHQLRIKSVDPTLYIQQLSNGVNKYQVGYQAAADKYKTVVKWVMDALVGATKATISVVKVL
jgi:hypothetical protein